MTESTLNSKALLNTNATGASSANNHNNFLTQTIGFFGNNKLPVTANRTRKTATQINPNDINYCPEVVANLKRAREQRIAEERRIQQGNLEKSAIKNIELCLGKFLENSTNKNLDVFLLKLKNAIVAFKTLENPQKEDDYTKLAHCLFSVLICNLKAIEDDQNIKNQHSKEEQRRLMAKSYLYNVESALKIIQTNPLTTQAIDKIYEGSIELIKDITRSEDSNACAQNNAQYSKNVSKSENNKAKEDTTMAEAISFVKKITSNAYNEIFTIKKEGQKKGSDNCENLVKTLIALHSLNKNLAQNKDFIRKQVSVLLGANKNTTDQNLQKEAFKEAFDEAMKDIKHNIKNYQETHPEVKNIKPIKPINMKKISKERLLKMFRN